MNKVLITGLALLSFGDSERCNLCNYDFSWIFNYPSVLLWADKIILTPFIKSVINECRYPDPDTSLPKAIKILFDLLEDSDYLTSARFGHSMIFSKLWFTYNKTKQGDIYECQDKSLT